MSQAVKKRQEFVLFNRDDKDVVKALPFDGDHNEIVKKSVDGSYDSNRDAIKELAKV